MRGTKRVAGLSLLTVACLASYAGAAAQRALLLGMTDKEIAARYDPVDTAKKVTMLDANGKERHMEWQSLSTGIPVAYTRMFWLEDPGTRYVTVTYDSEAPRYMTVGFNSKDQACCILPNYSRPAEFTRFMENQALWRKCSQSHILLTVFPTIKALEVRTITVPNLGRDGGGRLIQMNPNEVTFHETERARITPNVRYTTSEEAYAIYIEKEDTWDRTFRQKFEPILVQDAIRRGRKFIQQTPKPPEIEDCMVMDADTFWGWVLTELVQRFASGASTPKDVSRNAGVYLRDMSYENAALQQLGGDGVKPRLHAAITAAVRNTKVSIAVVEKAVLSAAKHEEAEIILHLTGIIDRIPYQARDRGVWILGVVKHTSATQAKKIPDSVRQRIAELQRKFDIDGDGALSSAETRNARSFLSK